MLNNQSEENKQIKSNLLRMYKQEMIGNEERKNQEKQLRIQEEKKNLDRANLQYEEERLNKQNQKSMLVNQRMEEYQAFINKKQTLKNKPKYPHYEKTPDQENKNPNVYSNDSNLDANYMQQNQYKRDENLNPIKSNEIPEPISAREYSRKEDNLKQNDYSNINNNNDKYQNYNTIEELSNRPNLNNLSNNPYNSNNTTNYNSNINPSTNPVNICHYNPQLSDHEMAVRTKKYEQQLQYKNYLDSQVSNNRSNRSQSSTKAYENINNIRKNNEPSNNPFSVRNYEFGLSNLNHNPILNPMNNYGYNKYITPSQINYNNQGVQSLKLPSSEKLKRAANNIIG